MAETIQFPSEIIEKILKYLDGKSLLKARSVCKQWKDIVDAIMSRYSNKDWHRLCMESIPYNTILEYVRGGHPSNIQMVSDHQTNDLEKPVSLEESKVFKSKGKPKLPPLDWESIFRRHQLIGNSQAWNEATIYDLKFEDIDIFDDNPISVAKINGDLIFTGHKHGLICMWSPDNHLLMITDRSHFSEITDIVFGDVFRVGPYALNKNCGDQRLYYATNHFMVSASADGQVCTRGLGLSDCSPKGLDGNMQCMALDRHLGKWVYLSISGNILATFSRDNSVMLWEILVPEHFVREPWKLPRFLPRSNMSIIGPKYGISCGRIWPNKANHLQQKLVCLTQSGINQTMFLSNSTHHTIEWHSFPKHKVRNMTLVVSDDLYDQKEELEQNVKYTTIRSTDYMFLPNEKIQEVKLLCLSNKELQESFGIVPEIYSKLQLDLNMMSIFTKVYRDDLYIICSRRRQLLISVNGQHFRIVGPFKNELRGHVTAVTFYANVFVIGFDSGHFSVFFTKGSFDLMTMDFEEPHFKSQTNEAIKDIDIAPGGNREEVCFLITTCESVQLYVISKAY